jgi:hypothetical protein
MPWKEVKPMEQKILFIADFLRGGRSFMDTVSSHGVMYCFGRYIYVGHVLTGERLGLEEVREGIWNTYFGPLVLGHVDLTEQKKNRHGYERLKV